MNKKYDVIYADPPWSYRDRSGQHSAREKYNTMALDDIKSLPVNKLSEKNSILFLWATVPLLPEAFEVMKAWGFEYKTMITWRKIMSLGMGYWFRGQTEHLLLGKKGNVRCFRSQQPNFHESRAMSHSTKPDYFRKLIDRTVTASFQDPKKLEMFARSAKNDFFPDHHLQGWDVFGNEVNNSIVLP